MGHENLEQKKVRETLKDDFNGEKIGSKWRVCVLVVPRTYQYNTFDLFDSVIVVSIIKPKL